MISKDWPIVKEVILRGKKVWLIDSRITTNGETTGSREYRKTKKEADGRADVIRGDSRVHGHNSGTISAALKQDAIRAEELLKPFNKTIYEAAQFLVQNLKKHQNSKKVSEAVEEWLKIKKAAWDSKEIEAETYKSAKYRIGIFKKKFSDSTIRNLDAAQIEEWLRSLSCPSASKANLKSMASEFLRWCIRKEWIDKNPCDLIEIKKKGTGQVKILSIDECKKLLEAAVKCPQKAHVTPYVIIGLFLGLRPSELQELTWEDIDFEAKHLFVKSDDPGRDRYIPLSDDIVSKLIQYKSKGLIICTNWKKIWRDARLLAGLNQYPADGMRHSFASYWLPIHNDRPRLVELMDNSLSIIRKHYRKAVTKQEAEEFWKLLAATHLN